FFFFQAEDGIRDKLVTGVQTCALPICHGGERLQKDPFGRCWLQAKAKCQAVRAALELPCDCVNSMPFERFHTGSGERNAHGSGKIGRASCRERVERGVGGGGWKKKLGW